MINHLLGEIYINTDFLKTIQTSSLKSNDTPGEVIDSFATYKRFPFIKCHDPATTHELEAYFLNNGEEIEKQLIKNIWNEMALSDRIVFYNTFNDLNFEEKINLIKVPQYVFNRDLSILINRYFEVRKKKWTV